MPTGQISTTNTAMPGSPGGAPAPGTPGGADPAMVVRGPTVSPTGQPIAPPAAPVAPAPAPAPVAPGAVVTAAPAVQNVTSQINTVNGLAATQRTAPVPMATLINPTTGDRQAVAVGSQQAQGLFGQGYVLETKAGTAKPGAPAPTPAAQPAAGTQPSGLTPLPNAPVAPDLTTEANKNLEQYNSATAAATAKSDAAFQQYTDSVNQMRNGTFPLTPDQQAQIDAITQQFQNMLADQKIANANYQGAINEAGITSGRSMYAPEVELGNVNAAIAAGSRALSDIGVKMSAAISSAKIAYQQSNFDMLDKLYSWIDQHQQEQQKVIEDTYNKTKDALEVAQQKFQNDMATANFNLNVATELNKPILEADAKLKDYLYSQAKKYSDAGITANDTVQQAVDKIKASKSYQDEQSQLALNQEATKANIAQSYASAAASRASAAKAYADLSNADTSAVQSWVTNIKNGTAKFSDVPKALKDAVSIGMSALGSQQDDILKSTQTALTDLQTMIDKNQGFSSAVGFRGPIGTFTGPISGTEGANFAAKAVQVVNELVLPNLTLLHGLGRVTDREFQTLSNALTALNVNTDKSSRFYGTSPLTEEKFKSELKTVTDTINGKVATLNQGGDLSSQVAAKGYDYQKMKADGNSDSDIKKALGL